MVLPAYARATRCPVLTLQHNVQPDYAQAQIKAKRAVLALEATGDRLGDDWVLASAGLVRVLRRRGLYGQALDRLKKLEERQ
eukprot:2451240-Rhodomonas_salina.3